MDIRIFLISVATIAVTGVPVPDPQIAFGFSTTTPNPLITIHDNISDLVCEYMLPIHNNSQPQDSEAPYIIHLSTWEVEPQGIVKVTVKSADGNNTIRGVYMQARNNNSDAVGEFLPTQNPNVIIADCSGGHNNSLLYVSFQPTNKLRFEWEAPDNQTEVKFYVTFVKDFSTFWKPITSETVYIKNSTAIFGE